MIEFHPKLQHLVHVDIYRKVIVRDGLFGLHQPLSNHLQEREIKLKFGLLLRGWSPSHLMPGDCSLYQEKDETDQQKYRQISGLTLRMLLMGMSVKIPAGAPAAVVGAGAAAAAVVGAAATACQ